MRAAISGRTEIGVAAIVITLVDVVVFLPISFIQSQIGRQLSEFAIVVVIATLTSLFVCFTITPSLAGNWALRSTWKPWGIIKLFTRGFDKLRDWYAHRALPWGLGHQVRSSSAFAWSRSSARSRWCRSASSAKSSCRRKIAANSSFSCSIRSARRSRNTTQSVLGVERAIRNSPDIDADTAVAGAYAAPFGGFVVQGNAGQIHVWLKDRSRSKSTDYWVAKFRDAGARDVGPGAQVTVVPATGTGGGNAQPLDELVTDIAGGDPTTYAAQVEQMLVARPARATSSVRRKRSNRRWTSIFDRAKAQALNVSIGTAATAARAAFGGAIATQFETADGLEQVQIIYPRQLQASLAELANVPIRSNTGADRSPRRFLALRIGSGLAADHARRPQHRHPSLREHHAGHVALERASGVHEAIDAMRVSHDGKPPLCRSNIVVRPRPLGQQDFMQQTLVGLGTSLILSIMLVFLLMVALYNSYRSPFIIMFSVPVAAVGALGALWITH